MTRRLHLIFALALSAFAQSPTVLNLSHDLVTNKIAASNMVPNSPTLDSRPLFEAGIYYASAHNIPLVIADTGSYYFLTQNDAYAHAVLNGISNVTVDLQYSDLYFAHGNIVGMEVVNTTNFTLRNFTIDYIQLPFTQLTVTSIDANARTIGVKQLGSYPLPSAFNSISLPPNYVVNGFYVFAFRNGSQLRTTGRMQAASPFTDTSIQINDTSPWAQSDSIATIQPGDTVVLTYRAGVAAIHAQFSNGLTLQNISIYASGFIGIDTNLGSGITINQVQVIPRPGTDRLISTNADGIHVTRAGANDLITNNTVRRGCDDAIAIDGQWYAIVNAANNGASVAVTRNSNSPLPIGMSFDFIDTNTGLVTGTASILGETPAPAQQTGAPGELVTLMLDHAITLQPNFGVQPSDPKLRGAGTIISGNLVQQETFARGYYPAGVANVTITDNLSQATNAGGILLEQNEALTYDYKTGPSSGIVIKNNIVDSAFGYGELSLDLQSAAAAINVVSYNQKFQWIGSTPFSNIAVTGNTVTNTIRTAVRLENVAGGQLTGNTILNYATQPNSWLWYLPGCCETLAQVQSEFAQPVVVTNSSSVTNSGNTTTGTWIANLSNADGGYRLAPESIVAAYGQFPAVDPPAANISVNVKDSAGDSRPATVLYSSTSQVDYIVPTGTAPGVATVTFGGGFPSAALIAPVGPGLFSANQSGKGVAAAFAILASANGTQTPEPVFQCSAGTCISVPLSLGNPTDILVVELYGTGIRGRTSLNNVFVEIGGAAAMVAYASSQPVFPGLDQINVFVPRSLAGAGEVPVVLTVDGVTANVVTVNIR